MRGKTGEVKERGLDLTPSQEGSASSQTRSIRRRSSSISAKVFSRSLKRDNMTFLLSNLLRAEHGVVTCSLCRIRTGLAYAPYGQWVRGEFARRVSPQ